MWFGIKLDDNRRQRLREYKEYTKAIFKIKKEQTWKGSLILFYLE